MLQQMLEVDHEQGHAWHTLGQMEEEQGQLQAAHDCFQRGTHSSGLSPQISFNALFSQ